jgi:hypothetical protein
VAMGICSKQHGFKLLPLRSVGNRWLPGESPDGGRMRIRRASSDFGRQIGSFRGFCQTGLGKRSQCAPAQRPDLRVCARNPREIGAPMGFHGEMREPTAAARNCWLRVLGCWGDLPRRNYGQETRRSTRRSGRSDRSRRRPGRDARAIDRGRAGGKLSGASRSGPECLGGAHGGRRAARQGGGPR